MQFPFRPVAAPAGMWHNLLQPTEQKSLAHD